MYASTSPPRPLFLASLSVIIPSDVEIIAIPNPLRTLGSSACFAYTLNPDLDILLNPVITLTFLPSEYFNVNVIVLPFEALLTT